MDMGSGQMAPPDVLATAPPVVASASAPAPAAVPEAQPQSVPANNNNHPSNLDIPAMPSNVNPGYLQDIPTLDSGKKPAV
jgi:hypothetical protein